MMTKRILTILLFTLISYASNAQSDNSLIGKWIFEDIHSKKFPPELKESISQNETFKKIYFEFKKDKKFEAYLMMQKLSGTWQRGEGILANKFRTYTKGGNIEYDIIKLTKSELIINVGNIEIVLKKTAD